MNYCKMIDSTLFFLANYFEIQNFEREINFKHVKNAKADPRPSSTTQMKPKPDQINFKHVKK